MAGGTYYHRYHTLRKQKNGGRKSAVDKLVYFAVVFGPLMTLPQLYSVWMLHQKGVSVATWSGYLVVAVIWLLYGLKHRDRPIIALQLLWLLLDAGIIVGVLL